MRICVVDDEAPVGEVVQMLLSLEGFDAQFFKCPAVALEAIRLGPTPDLLLTDFAMAPLNGMELIEAVLRVAPGMRTILYSGNVREEVIQQHALKPDAFLAKPFQPKRLIEVVREVLAAEKQQ